MGMVYHFQRASGVNASLVEFLRTWDEIGPFPLVVVPNGGLRTDEAVQQAAFKRGSSKAKSLIDTPHGRGGALDCAPYEARLVGGKRLWMPVYDRETNPGVARKFEIYGAIAKKAGFVWGGDWGWDYPHIEVKNWRALPYPAKVRAVTL